MSLPARLALLAALLAACASSPAQRPDEPLLEESQPSTARDRGAAPGTIRRADLMAVLSGSPGRFLAGVDAVPLVERGVFRGWRIRSFFPGDPRVGSVIRAGDIVLRVNDHAIERPDQFIETWQAAAARSDLTVDLVRAEQPVHLSWQIVDGK